MELHVGRQGHVLSSDVAPHKLLSLLIGRVPEQRKHVSECEYHFLSCKQILVSSTSIFINRSKVVGQPQAFRFGLWSKEGLVEFLVAVPQVATGKSVFCHIGSIVSSTIQRSQNTTCTAFYSVLFCLYCCCSFPPPSPAFF